MLFKCFCGRTNAIICIFLMSCKCASNLFWCKRLSYAKIEICIYITTWHQPFYLLCARRSKFLQLSFLFLYIFTTLPNMTIDWFKKSISPLIPNFEFLPSFKMITIRTQPVKATPAIPTTTYTCEGKRKGKQKYIERLWSQWGAVKKKKERKIDR